MLAIASPYVSRVGMSCAEHSAKHRGKQRAAGSALFLRKIRGWAELGINFQLRRRSAVVKSRCRRFVLCVLQFEWAIKINWLKIVFHNGKVKKTRSLP